MSNEAVAWALKQPIKPSAAKFVLVAMADCVNKDSFLAWPSVAMLTEATCQDRKTVLANVARLRQLGYIEDTGDRKGATGQIAVYRLKSPEIGSVQRADDEPKESQISAPKESQKRNSTESGTVPDFPANSPVFPHQESQISPVTVPNQGHGTVIGTVIGTVREPEKKERARRESSADAFRPDGVSDAVWRDFLAVRKAKRAPLTATAMHGIAREAGKAGITVPQAIEVCCERNWQAFKADWYAPAPSPQQAKPSKHAGFSERTYVGTDPAAIDWA